MRIMTLGECMWYIFSARIWRCGRDDRVNNDMRYFGMAAMNGVIYFAMSRRSMVRSMPSLTWFRHCSPRVNSKQAPRATTRRCRPIRIRSSSNSDRCSLSLKGAAHDVRRRMDNVTSIMGSISKAQSRRSSTTEEKALGQGIYRRRTSCCPCLNSNTENSNDSLSPHRDGRAHVPGGRPEQAQVLGATTPDPGAAHREPAIVVNPPALTETQRTPGRSQDRNHRDFQKLDNTSCVCTRRGPSRTCCSLRSR